MEKCPCRWLGQDLGKFWKLKVFFLKTYVWKANKNANLFFFSSGYEFVYWIERVISFQWKYSFPCHLCYSLNLWILNRWRLLSLKRLNRVLGIPIPHLLGIPQLLHIHCDIQFLSYTLKWKQNKTKQTPRWLYPCYCQHMMFQNFTNDLMWCQSWLHNYSLPLVKQYFIIAWIRHLNIF